MAEPISKAVVTDAMMAFIRSIDPQASKNYNGCQARVGGTLISANLGDQFESVRSVFESTIEQFERNGFFRRNQNGKPMSTEPQVLPPTELALTDHSALVALHEKLESVRESENRLNQFILEALQFTAESAVVLRSADEFAVDSEAALQVADVRQSALKQDVAGWKDRRLGITRPLDDLKSAVMGPLKDGVIRVDAAIEAYQSKISAYRRELKASAEKAQREAERLLREEREAKEAEARKLEEKAAKLKTPAAQERLMHEADEIRQVAAMMPESVALAASAPQTVASNVAEIWEVDQIQDTSAYLRWLADHPEWHCVLNFKAAEHNRLAKQFHVIGVPGLKFKQRDSFRSKPGRG